MEEAEYRLGQLEIELIYKDLTTNIVNDYNIRVFNE